MGACRHNKQHWWCVGAPGRTLCITFCHTGAACAWLTRSFILYAAVPPCCRAAACIAKPNGNVECDAGAATSFVAGDTVSAVLQLSVASNAPLGPVTNVGIVTDGTTTLSDSEDVTIAAATTVSARRCPQRARMHLCVQCSCVAPWAASQLLTPPPPS